MKKFKLIRLFLLAFASWFASQASAITIAGTATDSIAILQIDNKTPSARDKSWEINVTAGTVKAGVSASDLTLTGLSAGLTYTAAKGTGNSIVITLAGVATTALTADAALTAIIKGSAVTESAAQNSAGIALKLWHIGPGTTFVLTNEGGLIDDLIRAGHGTKNLYQTLEMLKPKSGGIISNRFMATLAACPAGSDIFTVALSIFAPLNNPICINSDGTLSIQAIFGKDLFTREGYSTLPENKQGYTSELFTYALNPEKYIDAGDYFDAGESPIHMPYGSRYKAFAIAWKASTTFVLSNEGGLIVDLIRAGHGTKNLYQTLEVLKPKSGGIISDEFMATLAACPAGSDIFTAALNNFAGLNNPVCINTDGTLGINPIFGKDYITREGYNTSPENQQGYTSELFSYALSPDNYIDAGESYTGRYKAFAIAWKASTTFVLSNEGGLIDDLIRAGHGTKNLYQTLQVLQPKSGGIISDEFMAALANCPAGSDIFTVALSNFSVNYPVCINTDGTILINPIYGTDYLIREGYNTLSENQHGYSSELFSYALSPAFYINAGSSESSGGTTVINYKAFAIAWKASTTFVLTNEGGLIDDLIRAGHGTKNLYQTLEVLQPKSGGIISDEFMATLANCPAGSDIFTVALSNFAGLNNPVCFNTDGILGIRPIHGKDYFGKEGYTTYPESQTGEEKELFTYAINTEYYIDAGFSESGSGIIYYKAFAIVWALPPTNIAKLTDNGFRVFPNPTSGQIRFFIPENSTLEKVELIGVAGQTVAVFKNPQENTIDLSGLASGVYLLKLATNGRSYFKKIMKE